VITKMLLSIDSLAKAYNHNKLSRIPALPAFNQKNIHSAPLAT
jgi:hypothetical protein